MEVEMEAMEAVMVGIEVEAMAIKVEVQSTEAVMVGIEEEAMAMAVEGQSTETAVVEIEVDAVAMEVEVKAMEAVMVGIEVEAVAMQVNQHPPISVSHHRRRRCGCTMTATERGQIAYSSLLRRSETAHADPKAMQARLIRSRLA